MKRIISFAIAIIIALGCVVFANAAGEIEVKAPSAILVEKSTGTVLFEKDAGKQMRPASVTKIMTLLLIMEAIEKGQYSYDDIVTVSAYATSMGGSQVYLKEGEKFTVNDMIKCIAVASANDCCVAMAEFTSGSVDAFVSAMNVRAQELGMNNTTFINCTGLDADGHLTTARDISIMSQELLKHEKIKEYTTIWMDSIRDGTFGLTNTNKLIRFYSDATGLKTGYTQASGYCISATAMRDGMELIAVVMAAESSDARSADAKTMFNYGFSKYELFVPKTPEIEPVRVIKGKQKDITPITSNSQGVLIEKGSSKDIEYELDICKDVKAPVESGQKLGEVTIKSKGEILCKSDVVSPDYLPKASVFDIFFEILNHFLMV